MVITTNLSASFLEVCLALKKVQPVVLAFLFKSFISQKR